MTATESLAKVGDVYYRFIGSYVERCPYCPRILEYRDEAGLKPSQCECRNRLPRLRLNVYGKQRPFASRYLRGLGMGDMT